MADADGWLQVRVAQGHPKLEGKTCEHVYRYVRGLTRAQVKAWAGFTFGAVASSVQWLIDLAHG